MIQRKFWNIFYIFIPSVQSNEGSKTLQAKMWMVTIKRLPYTVLLNLEIVCHLGKLNAIKDYSKLSTFTALFLLLQITTNEIVQMGVTVLIIAVYIIYTSH